MYLQPESHQYFMRLITFLEAKYDLGKPDDETNGSAENDEVGSDVSPTSLLCYNFLTEQDLHFINIAVEIGRCIHFYLFVKKLIRFHP